LTNFNVFLFHEGLTRIQEGRDIRRNYSSICKIDFHADAREARNTRNLFVIDFIIGFNQSRFDQCNEVDEKSEIKQLTVTTYCEGMKSPFIRVSRHDGIDAAKGEGT
jgi:hypothetical protein